MTMEEIRQFLGYKNIQAVSRMFRRAAEEMPSIKSKIGLSTRAYVPDYTLEECLFAFKFVDKESFEFTPALIRLFKEAFIYRDTAMKITPKAPKITPAQRQFILNYYYMRNRYKKILQRCVTCKYMCANTINKNGSKPSPYCSFYGVFINKTKPKRNVYLDCCPTYDKSWTWPFIFTQQGLFSITDFDSKGKFIPYKKPKTDMLGIPQSQFKSKRKRNEDVIILKDAFL